MASDGDVDTGRAHVQTYVPEYQKAEWASEAEALNMSLSEFVRSMVQAGRSDISVDTDVAAIESADEPAATPSSTPEPRGSGVEDRVVDILESDEFYDWDELVAALTDDVEERLEDALQELQADGEVQYSGRNGGYTLV
ncbi:hypothetical protein SAMN05216559_3078 [Halomicrobium zhouii]|uniref:Uncharacterized protein n=1 Tax=Halomicrobium zhouii TaxID=767519 RepID=A0A1I6LTC4_9EURY|nr:DUF5805 domain-containing protein [Halomicrobium zhouii]SFS06678.1 hypothetical protein SAMN05216559_3078 [Halomicrobium zhouii]